MSTTPGCPAEPVIAAWLSGDIDEDLAESIGVHVDECETCSSTTTRLEMHSQGIAKFLRDAVAEGSPKATGAFLPERYPKSGKRIGDYQILERLGGGGMGSVFRAMHVRLRRDVALKVLTERSASDERAIARFSREMEVVGRLNHPNIVQALDAGEVDGTNYLAMELLNGADLSRVLAGRATLSIADATEVARQAALGLSYAHERGMVHRDVKPSNLMLACENDGRTRVKILDLGLAMMQEATPEAELTDAGQLMGTLEYMAPEQTEDTHSVDHTADIYALGSTLYRMLVGHVPFTGDAWNTPAKRLNGLMHQEAPGIGGLRDDLPDDLVALIDSMLERDPARRPANMNDVAEALLPFTNTHNLRALPGIASTHASVAPTHGIQNAFDDTQPTVLIAEPPREATKWTKAALIVASCLIVVLAIPAASAIRSWLGSVPASTAPDRTQPTPTDSTEPAKPFAAKLRASEGLIGLWAFESSDDGMGRDLSGHGLHATITGSLQESPNAPIPQGTTSLCIGRSGSMATIPDDPILHTPNALTIAFWLRNRQPFDSESAPIIDKSSESGGFAVSLSGRQAKKPRRVNVRISDGSAETVITAKTQTGGSWHHVAVTLGDGHLQLYINGQLDGSAQVDHEIGINDADLVLGTFGQKGSRANIDEVCLYDRPLSEDEVVALTRFRPAPAMATVPFDVTQAVEVQTAWAEHLELPIEFTSSAGILMRLVPPGEFEMGMSDDDVETMISWYAKKKRTRESYRSELPRHTVRISQPFYIGVHEVTQQQYLNVTGETPSHFPSAKTEKALGELPRDDLPVEQISWTDCVSFCNLLSSSDDLPVCYTESDDAWVRTSDSGYRLPTEAEWEFACRAGTESMWSYGNGRAADFASNEWSVLNARETTHPVGQLKPNAFGLFDMHGNVIEWCSDWFDPEAYASRAGAITIDPVGPETGTRRVYRGGSWWQRRPQSRSSFRGSHFPGFSFQEHGMRLVLDVSAAKTLLDNESGTDTIDTTN